MTTEALLTRTTDISFLSDRSDPLVRSPICAHLTEEIYYSSLYYASLGQIHSTSDLGV